MSRTNKVIENEKKNTSKCSHDFAFTFASRLKLAREHAGFTQAIMAEKLKVETRTYQKWEACSKSNHVTPNFEIISKLCDILNCDFTYLTGENDENKFKKNIASASQETGLSYNAIDALSFLDNQDIILLNALIERGDIILLKHAIQNYFRQSYKNITISGLGDIKSIDEKEKEKIFRYISNSFIEDIFNSLVHDKKITNTFMQDATTSFYKSFEDCIDKNNNLYEQTEQRKEFIGNVKDIIENEIDKNKKYDYFSSFTKDTNKK